MRPTRQQLFIHPSLLVIYFRQTAEKKDGSLLCITRHGRLKPVQSQSILFASLRYLRILLSELRCCIMLKHCSVWFKYAVMSSSSAVIASNIFPSVTAIALPSQLTMSSPSFMTKAHTYLCQPYSPSSMRMDLRQDMCSMGATILIFGIASILCILLCLFLPMVIPAIIRQDYDLFLTALTVLSFGYWVIPCIGIGLIIASQLPGSAAAFFIFYILCAFAFWLNRIRYMDVDDDFL